MTLSEKQQIIVKFIRGNGQIETSQANNLLKPYYYHNHEHYVSEILTNMVKRRYIKRVRRGVYEIGSFASSVPGIVDKNQTNLF